MGQLDDMTIKQSDTGQLGAMLGRVTSDDVDIDFTEAVSFDPLPDGTYRVVVDSVEPGFSAENNPKVVFNLVVTGIVSASEQEGRLPLEKAVGRKLRKDCPTTGKGSGITKKVLVGLGYNVNAENFRFSMSSAVGRQADATVELSTNNPDFNNVRRLTPVAGGTSSL